MTSIVCIAFEMIIVVADDETLLKLVPPGIVAVMTQPSPAAVGVTFDPDKVQVPEVRA